jgi:hypothetical protein
MERTIILLDQSGDRGLWGSLAFQGSLDFQEGEAGATLGVDSVRGHTDFAVGNDFLAHGGQLRGIGREVGEVLEGNGL